jgi:hypothetical protein
MQFQMNRFFSQLVKGRFFYVVLFSNFFINCSLTSKTDCDYSGISLKLIRDIKDDNSSQRHGSCPHEPNLTLKPLHKYICINGQKPAGIQTQIFY